MRQGVSLDLCGNIQKFISRPFNPVKLPREKFCETAGKIVLGKYCVTFYPSTQSIKEARNTKIKEKRRIGLSLIWILI